MILDIILPYKEIFSEEKASAVSITIKNSAEYSVYKSNIRIIGQFVNNPFVGLNFHGIKINKLLHLGNNRSILINYLKLLNTEKETKRIIEIHNRPYLFNLAVRKEKKYPISLHFHNDPRDMKGSKTINQRIFIAQNAAAVYFVSNYIKDCFLEGIINKYSNLHIIPNAIQRTLIKQTFKKKEVLFVGRLVSEKGAHIYVESIRKLVSKHPDWKFIIIGTSKAGNVKLSTSYEKKLIADFDSLGENTKYLGFLPNKKVKQILEQVSILIVPSLWEEPFALTALEGVCSGAAVIASRVGGMKEMLQDTGLLIPKIDSKKLEKSIENLIKDDMLLKQYQNKAWQNYQYNQSDIIKLQDQLREKIIINFFD
tara:strand:+ start:4104 stop:5207 length:1104 start_codon:yes stop_codon:yes gene_type:complete